MKQYHQKQKEILEQWFAESGYDDRHESAKLRHEEMLAKKKAREAEKESAKKTVKQLEAMEKARRLHVAVEERPPLPPRAHDLPRPVLEIVDEAKPKATPRTSKAPAPGSWKAQAKAVSNVYGLTDKERTVVKDQLLRSIKGAGRMAAYEKLVAAPPTCSSASTCSISSSSGCSSL